MQSNNKNKAHFSWPVISREPGCNFQAGCVWGVSVGLERPLVSANGPGAVSPTRLGSQAQAEAQILRSGACSVFFHTLHSLPKASPETLEAGYFPEAVSEIPQSRNTVWSGSR